MNAPTCKCGTVLTPENATVCPEYFFCDECAIKFGVGKKPVRTLDEIAIACQTDRASVFTRTYAKPHDYARHYDRVFTPLRDASVKLLEIGVGGGEGVKMWMDYFHNGKARFFGADTTHDTNAWDTPKLNGGEKNRYFFNCGDQSDETFWRCWLADHGGDLDIVIDDGSHISEHIIKTFHFLWPFVKSGGFYSIEDLSVAPLAMNWLQRLAKENDGTIDSMYFAKELCIIRKA